MELAGLVNKISNRDLYLTYFSSMIQNICQADRAYIMFDFNER